MSVWLVCPSARPVEHVREWAAAWRERGYKIALWRDGESGPSSHDVGVDLMCYGGPYPGYARAVNQLVAFVAPSTDFEWAVIAGDDIYPDPSKTAEEIARECSLHFAQMHAGADAAPGVDMSVKSIRAALKGIEQSTFGVMQPTGDPWSDSQGRIIERIAGSAWYGREYCRRINRGHGPLWPEYKHMFVDEEARAVAVKHGVYWERPDLTQLHQHWGRPKPGEKFGDMANMPEFLKEVNSPEHWKVFKALFEARKAAGFPGSEPL